MKRLFNTNFSNETVHFMLLVTRVGISALILTHGYQKLQMILSGGEIQFADPIGIGATATLYLAVFAEFFCSILLILGLASRLATIPLITTMLVAVLIVHAQDPFEKKEHALHFLLVYLLLLVVGPGKYSLDRLINPSSGRRRR